MEIHRARMPIKEEAALLEISTNLPVLEIVRVGTSGADDKPVEVTECSAALAREHSTSS
jgi:GntR family transcriptional regulator